MIVILMWPQSEVHFKPSTNLELSNALAHDERTCPLIHNIEKISGPRRSINITEHFTCTFANVIYCIACTYCNKLYIGEI